MLLEECWIMFLCYDRQTPPAPRFDHTAAVHGERYLLIFGGCSHASFFNDLHVLDLQSVSAFVWDVIPLFLLYVFIVLAQLQFIS